MKRLYEILIKNDLHQHNQMIFLSGPRQVGKTTIARYMEDKNHPFHYINWDVLEIRQKILQGPMTLGQFVGLEQLLDKKPLIIFDEIHKYGKWKIFLKGFYDLYKEKAHIIVTGSAKLNIYKKGGDSLMGRYLHYNIFPLSLGEVLHPESFSYPCPPKQDSDQTLERLLTFGGFPEPYLKGQNTFHKQWEGLRRDQLFREDIVTLTSIREIQQMEILSIMLSNQTGQLLNRSTFSKHINVSVSTISKWLSTFEAFYFCFFLSPWSANVPRSLIKEPIGYLYDWSLISDKGAKVENLIAVHLYKAVKYWTDTGQGSYGLHFVRDKEKREVDFLVTRDNKPWFLVEVKSSNNVPLSKNLKYFHEKLGTQHAFQVVYDMPYVNADCFKHKDPIIVPAQTFLSQLL